jgi:XapX domain-containing protein
VTAAEVSQGLALGLLVGAVFGLFRLAPPAPASWAGIAGIVGIFLGWLVVGAVVERLGQ